MRIAIVRHSILNRGADRLLFDYTDYLIRQGHSIVYHTNEMQTDLTYNQAIEFKNISKNGKLGTVLHILCGKFDEDIVLVDLVAMACLGWLRNRKKILYFAQDFDVSYYSSALMRRFISFCYWFAFQILKVSTISVSPGLSEKLAVFKPNKIITVPNGVDLKKFFVNTNSRFISQKKSSKIILLFVRPDYRKGLDIAIKALQELFSTAPLGDWVVWAIGDKLQPIYNAKIVNYGFFNNDDLRDVLSAADIYLLPSRSEGLSTLLLQALACGCAVAVTTAASIITHEQEGLVSSIEDSGGLAKNIKRLLSDDTLREKCKHNAHLLVEQFSLEKSRQNFEQALKTLQNTR